MIISIGNVNCFISEASKLELERINRILTCYAPNYKYTQMYKRKLWNGQVSLFQDNSFPTGLLPRIIKVCKNITLKDVRSRPEIRINPNTQIPLRSYQLRVLNKALNNKYQGLPWYRGIIKISCGGGKTIIAAAISQITDLTTLFIVDRQELLTQAEISFRKFGIEVGISVEDPKKITIITIQSLMQFVHKTNKETASGKVRTEEEIQEIIDRKLEKGEKILSYLSSVQQIFMDEAHGIAASLDQGNMMYRALSLMPNAYMRWGLTATPFERDEYSNLLLEGSTGELLIEITARELIELGYLAEPKIKFYRSNYSNIPKKWPLSYTYGIILNEKRNNKIVEETIKLPKPCLIITSSIQHGEILKEKFSQKNIEVPFVSGKDDSETRNNLISYLKEGKVPIVIANRIWNKGVDIPNVESVILAAAGGSTSTIRQIIGRGIRVSENKNSFHFVDFFDGSPASLRKQSTIRRMVFISDGYDVKEENF